ncbi:MAG: thioredoxin domain-containing protein, partial [Methanomicrobiales archaeon]|nr:thioredoxin domain-containing protein [Methanomicrobiales archaeon]
MTGGRPNRLIHEKSPYLLQHSRNPVDWYPWGEEAFARARDGDRPVFLSIGYSTCHWCHVMARESFENPRVAALMNESFVNIKVDREERPDIDQVYMAAALTLTGTGGWPLTILMTPEKKPFFAATYIPPGGEPGQT